MMSFNIRASSWPADKDTLQNIRHRVFIEEQSVPAELEWDGNDEQAYHWLALDTHNNAIGTVRMLNGKIGRMAVLSEYRQQGIGKALLEAAITHAEKMNYFDVYLHAQVQALGFYQSLGFVAYGEEFMDANIPHLSMRRQLAARRQIGVHGGDFSVVDFSDTALGLIAQAQTQLHLLSYDLDPVTFDKPEMAEYISQLARKSRYTDIKILLIDSSLAIKRGHRLVNLQRRLPSSIKLRAVSCEAHEVKNNLILVDQCAIICQSIKEREKAWANFNNKPVVNNYNEQFDYWWERAREDKDLRQLEI